jgi:DNA processing protein
VVDLAAWVALSLVEHVGSRTLSALFQHFGDDPQAILRADARQLQAVPGIGPKIARGIQAVDVAQVRQALAGWQTIGISTVPCLSADYPPRLLNTDDPPATVFMRGTWHPQDNRAVAIVGTREPSARVARLAQQVGAALAEAGVTVVSGLALGIDTAAHQGALAAASGRSVSVLGSGVLNIYPPENHTLAMDIASRGVLMSEVHPAAPTSAPRLVARNRIISGLSRALVVVETDADGGAMHAARFARRQGCPVFTFDLKASGNRELLEKGAHMLHTGLDNLDCILEGIDDER